MPRKKATPSGLTALSVSEGQLQELRAGIRLREDELVKARKYLQDRSLSATDIDELLIGLRGDGPTRLGLKALLGFRDEVDPNQTDVLAGAEEEGGSAGPQAVK